MKFSLIFLNFTLLLLLYLPSKTLADPRTKRVVMTCNSEHEHNTTIYVPNFVATMDNISDQIRTTGFGTSIVGLGLDTSYGLAQCYGDLSLIDCVLCYAEARTLLPQCYPNNGGRIYLDGCFMRAENYSFFGEYSGPNDTAKCGNQTRKGAGFAVSVQRAMSNAVSAAKSQGYGRATAAGTGVNASSFVLANCWRTVNESGCAACLDNATRAVSACLPWSEGRALNTGCFLRYSDVDFLNAEHLDPDSSQGNVLVMIIIVLSLVAIISVGFIIGVFILKQRRIQKKRKGSNDAEKASTLYDSNLNFKYSTLERATGSFDINNKLGQGGFGSVYKGVLADGREVAVKRLFFNNRHRAADFYNEVNIISSVEHRNLVRLLGCSCSGPESLLVYEYLPNKSLDRFLFGADPIRGKALDWEKRFEIITGTAEGLVYLHEDCKIRIIHRDIKASNILLDSKLRAKIADFGLARSFQEDKSHISTAIAGTLGYMAPEYLAHGQLTEKADVYSYGVLLIEIISGKQNNRGNASEFSESLVTAAWKHFQMGTLEELIDPNLGLDNYINSRIIKSEILRVVHVGLLCVQEIPALRPSISRALQMLVKKEEQLPPPSNPPFLDEKTMELNDACEDVRHLLNPSASIATVSYSEFYPR